MLEITTTEATKQDVASIPPTVIIGLGHEVKKTLFIQNSAEHENYPAHKRLTANVKMSPIVGILTFISIINTTSERLKARHVFICRYFSFYEQFQFRAMKKVL